MRTIKRAPNNNFSIVSPLRGFCRESDHPVWPPVFGSLPVPTDVQIEDPLHRQLLGLLAAVADPLPALDTHSTSTGSSVTYTSRPARAVPTYRLRLYSEIVPPLSTRRTRTSPARCSGTVAPRDRLGGIDLPGLVGLGGAAWPRLPAAAPGALAGGRSRRRV